jgi:hypothetical protein
MSSPNVFRRTLAARLFTLIAATVPVASLATAGCTPGGGECGTYPGTECLDIPASGMCYSNEEALALFEEEGRGVVEVTGPAAPGGGGGAGGEGGAGGGGTATGCCYDVKLQNICGGRPFVVEQAARTAVLVRDVRQSLPRGATERHLSGAGHDDGQPASRDDWHAAAAGAPSVDNLSPETRALLADEWSRDGLFEHASVASFGRFALELLAVGAPADLIQAAHRAALDEVEHARLCLALASAYAGENLRPGPFPFGGPIEVTADLASLAARTVTEGCLGETIAAAVAAEQLAGSTDPAVRHALTVIVEDEARHAELAWRTVAWAIRAGGARVRDAVAAAFSTLERGAPILETAADERLAAHGRLGAEAVRAATARAVAEVIAPAARLLLSAPAGEPSRPAMDVPRPPPRALARA